MRLVWLPIIATAVAAAQDGPPAAPPAAPVTVTAPQTVAQAAPPEEALAAAQQTAQRTAKDWMMLAQGLDEQLAPLLPCDPKARRTIQDVSRASDARVAALAAYLRLAATQAADQTTGARRLLAAEESRAPEAADERTDAALERSAVEAHVANLTFSSSARPGLNDAQGPLGQITEIVSRRSVQADQHASERDRGVAALRDLVAADQAREAALKEETAAFQTEAARWNTYYTVRLARAQAECSSIGGGTTKSAAPARRATKNKAKAKQQE